MDRNEIINDLEKVESKRFINDFNKVYYSENMKEVKELCLLTVLNEKNNKYETKTYGELKDIEEYIENNEEIKQYEIIQTPNYLFQWLELALDNPEEEWIENLKSEINFNASINQIPLFEEEY